MITKEHCLIITNQLTQSNRLATWLVASGYQVHFVFIEGDELQLKQRIDYTFVFLHPGFWKLCCLQNLTVNRSFVLVSGLKDCHVDFLEDQVPFHIREPFRPSQLKRLEYLIKKEKGQLLADCIIVKSVWQYYKVPLNRIDFLQRNQAINYTTIHAGSQQLVVFGILTAWERQLHCTGNFERVADNLLIADRHIDHVKGDYFMLGTQRIRLIRRYIDTRAYGRLKKNFPARYMDLQESS